MEKLLSTTVRPDCASSRCWRRSTGQWLRRATWCTSILDQLSPYLLESQLEMSLSTLVVTNQTAVRSSAILDHYRCADTVPDFTVAGEVKEGKGFFRFGPSVVCYGRCTS